MKNDGFLIDGEYQSDYVNREIGLYLMVKTKDGAFFATVKPLKPGAGGEVVGYIEVE